MDWNKPIEMLCGGIWVDVKVVLTPSDSKDNGAYGVTNGRNTVLFTKEGTSFGEFNSSRAWYQPGTYKIRNKKETVTQYEWENAYFFEKVWSITEPTDIRINFTVTEYINKKTQTCCGCRWTKTGRTREFEIGGEDDN